jgi:SAM-dependent methyltransferase
MKRWDIINKFIEKNEYKDYLEVGVQSGMCRDHINLPNENKTTVDPDDRSNNPTHLMTSDEFFKQNDKTFDIIFIDGLHHGDQVLKDIENSLEVLNEGGTILCHDMLPNSDEMQRVPRVQDIWTGDCWKAWFKLRGTRKDLFMFIIPSDWGVGIIQVGSQEIVSELDIPLNDMDWDLFTKHNAMNSNNKMESF